MAHKWNSAKAGRRQLQPLVRRPQSRGVNNGLKASQDAPTALSIKELDPGGMGLPNEDLNIRPRTPWVVDQKRGAQVGLSLIEGLVQEIKQSRRIEWLLVDEIAAAVGEFEREGVVHAAVVAVGGAQVRTWSARLRAGPN